MALQVGSRSTFIRTAGVLLKKIGGGSAFHAHVFRDDLAIVEVGEYAKLEI